MSIDMCVRFYYHDAPPTDELFCAIARTLAGWAPARDTFNGFAISKKGRDERIMDCNHQLSIEELCRLASGKRDPDYYIFTTSSFKCWRFRSGAPEREVTAYWLGAQGPDAVIDDHRIVGQAELAIPAGPFTEWVERFHDPHRDEVNQRVAENAEAIVVPLLMEFALKLKPSSIKIYHDDCFAVPLNAHFAYYRDEQAVLDDLRLIEEVWERGLPVNRIGPLKNRDHFDMANVLHEMRGAESGDRIWEELNTLLPMKAQPTWADVERVLQSGKYANFTMREGFAVLDYPYFMNAFMDKFYLDVLKEAANR